MRCTRSRNLSRHLPHFASDRAPSCAITLCINGSSRETAMGPFPHDAPPATISAGQPRRHGRFRVRRVRASRARRARASCSRTWAMSRWPGTSAKTSPSTARATSTTSINPEPGSHAARFVAAAWALRPVDGLARGRRPARARARRRLRRQAIYRAPTSRSTCPPSIGIGGSLLYFVERYGAKGSPYDRRVRLARRARSEAAGASASTISIT